MNYRRIRNAIGQFLGVAAESQPAAAETIQALQAALRERLAHFNRSLAASAQFRVVLQQQLAELEVEERSLRAALERQAHAGGPASAGAELALRLEAARQEMATAREQLEQAVATCDEITQARDAAIEEARQQLAACQGALSEAELRRIQ